MLQEWDFSPTWQQLLRKNNRALERSIPFAQFSFFKQLTICKIVIDTPLSQSQQTCSENGGGSKLVRIIMLRNDRKVLLRNVLCLTNSILIIWMVELFILNFYI